jgi:hypothetical protein
MNKVCIFINLESMDYIVTVGLLRIPTIIYPVLVSVIWAKLCFRD